MTWVKENVVRPMKHVSVILNYLFDRYVLRKKDEYLEDFDLQLRLNTIPIPSPIKEFPGLALEVRITPKLDESSDIASELTSKSTFDNYAAVFMPKDIKLLEDMFYTKKMKNPRIKISGKIVRSNRVLFEAFNYGQDLSFENLKDLEKLLSKNEDCYVVYQLDFSYPDFESLKEQLEDLPIVQKKDK